MNPIVKMNIELKKIVTSMKPEIETADDMKKISEHRNLNYNARIVGESNDKVQPKLESRYTR